MKLPFEQWFENENFSEDVKSIFKDAVLCYKNGIDRPALLLSYTGFMQELKKRILFATKPNPYKEAQWNQKLKEIKNEDKWEQIVFDSTQEQGKTDIGTGQVIKQPIFFISDDIRNQILYWKNRRNDCAHCKANKIDPCHVEAFWTFLQSNLSKITVEGGKQTLLTKIENHYDVNFTPQDADAQPLIKKIATVITNEELNEFWNECAERISGEHWRCSDANVAQFFDSIISHYANNQFSYIKDSLLSFIDDDCLCDFLSECPRRIIDFCNAPQVTRNFWMQKLKHCRNPLNIYAVMLNAGLIPQNEIDEAHAMILDNMSSNHNNFRSYEVENFYAPILRDKGFSKSFEQKFFTESQFQYFTDTNNRADLLYGFLQHNEFTDNIVTIICNEYHKPQWSSDWLLERIKKLFQKYPEKKQQFEEIASQINMDIPQRIHDLL